MNRSGLENISTDVLVVGAGPVGMALAATVSRYGMKATVIECSECTTPYSKAIGIHAITLEKMNTLGLTERLLADGFPMRDYALYDGGRRTMATSFGGLPTAYDFVLGLPQSRTEAHLAADLVSQGVEVLWQHKLIAIQDIGSLTDPQAAAIAQIRCADGSMKEISAKYIVGCDGGRSTTREAVGIGFEGGSYGKAFLLGDVELDWDNNRHELQFHLSRHGYLLLIPMPDGMHRVIAQIDLKWEDFQNRDTRPEAKLELLQRVIDERGPGNITAHSPRWLTAAPFYHRIADVAHKERVFLAGDAMHLVSPLGAQGLNTGLGDAFNLGWKLGYVHQGKADASLLDSYGAERLALADKLIGITSRTTRYITATRWWERFARRAATRALNSSQKVQRDLPALLSGIRQAYDPALLGGVGPASAWPKAGTRLPRARLQGSQGDCDISSLVHGQSFSAIFLLRRLDQMSERLLHAELDRLAGFGHMLRPIVIARETGANWRGIDGVLCLSDPYADVTGQIGDALAATALIRPDGFVAASATGLSADLCIDYFSRTPWETSLLSGGLRHVA